MEETNGNKKWYEEKPGQTSMMRISMLLSLFFGTILAVMVIWLKYDAGIFLPVSLWGISTTGKAAQKFGEK